MRIDRRNFLIGSTLPLLMSAASKPKIKIAQIGTGHAHASGKMQAVRKYPEIFNVAGIAEPDPKRSKALNAFYSNDLKAICNNKLFSECLLTKTDLFLK